MSAVGGGEWSTSRLGRFSCGNKPRYTLIRRLFGLQSRSALFLEENNILSVPEFETLARPARSRSPRQLSVLFLGAFAKYRNAIISFVMSVRVSVRMEQLGSNWSYFHEIWRLSISPKSVEKIQVSLKSEKNNGYFTWRPKHIFDHKSLTSS
jgi:hypothetical protein